MDETAHDPVASEQLRITIEIGDGYEPTQRLAGALQELALALEEADAAADEVAGFASFESSKINFTAGLSFSYDSLGRGGTVEALWNEKHKFPTGFDDKQHAVT